MKKLLLASLCMTAVALTACDKKPNDTAAKTENGAPAATLASMSHDNAADIKSDLNQIETLSNTKAQEALKFQNEVNEAAQKGEKSALDAVVVKMDTYVAAFNKDLDALKLKSSEADSLRGKMKESNDLGLELAKAGVENPPNMTKITELQKKATDLQQALLTEMQTLQVKVNGK